MPSESDNQEASGSQMRAEVTTYGGEKRPDGIRTVQHWQLSVNGRFVADTSNSADAELFYKIAERCNS